MSLKVQLTDEEEEKIDPTAQAEGAIPNGTEITKVNSESEDLVNDGEKGIVIGSKFIPQVLTEGIDFGEGNEHLKNVRYIYFIQWESMEENQLSVIIESKIKEV